VDISVIDAVAPPRRYLQAGITFDPVRRWLPVITVTRQSLQHSDDARVAVYEAVQAAGRLQHNYIGTEHLLLGLITENNTATAILMSIGVDLETVRQHVEEIVGVGRAALTGQAVFTPRARRALQLAQNEAIRTGCSEVGPEHILAGLVREGEGVAAQVLVRLGADFDRVRRSMPRNG
jgi:ATP-dependent Clp protease ATP-binding subunit ClpC